MAIDGVVKVLVMKLMRSRGSYHRAACQRPHNGRPGSVEQGITRSQAIDMIHPHPT